ncbi:MAG: lipocalin family protein [Gemmobacter sp.]|nr:lipocalin family protein [Gemmobacter sp.]
MPRLIAALLLVTLAGCAGAPDPVTAFRDTATPIYSNAVLDPARLEGTWRQVGTFASGGGTSGGNRCDGGQVRFGAPQGGRLPVMADLCLDGLRQAFRGEAAVTAPGRFVLAGAKGALAEPWWVLWADHDNRSLVIGTPSGRMGFILDRSAEMPGDRITAAREILDWNGYALSGLRMF